MDPLSLVTRSPLNTAPLSSALSGDNEWYCKRRRGETDRVREDTPALTPTHKFPPATHRRSYARCVDMALLFSGSFPSSSRSEKMPVCSWFLVLSLAALTGKTPPWFLWMPQAAGIIFRKQNLFLLYIRNTDMWDNVCRVVMSTRVSMLNTQKLVESVVVGVSPLSVEWEGCRLEFWSIAALLPSFSP